MCQVAGGSNAPLSQSASQWVGSEGFFRLAQDGGVWWLVTPENERFFSIGVNHIDPNLLLNDADRAGSVARYGADLEGENDRANAEGEAAKAFMDDSLNTLESWGFNSLGGQNYIPQSRLPYVATFRPAVIENWPVKKSFPDPFAPATAKMVDEKAQKWAATRRDDPLIMGVTTTAMPLWATRSDRIHEWVRTLMTLGPKAPGKKVFIEVLKDRHPGPVAAAKAYGVKGATWSDLAQRTQWPKPAQPERVVQDQEEVLKRIAAAWYPLVTQAVRTHMPNHLFFGDKIVPWRDLPEWLVPIVAAEFDVLYFQWYDHADAQMERLNRLYEQTGKPVLMGDSSFAHPNERVPKPKGVPVASQAEVGTAYADYLSTMAARPWFIGWHHCGYMEGAPDLKRIGPLIARQNGFLRADGTIYEDTVSAVKVANEQAFAQHQRASIDPGVEVAAGAPFAHLECATETYEGFSLRQVGDQVFELRVVEEHGSPSKPLSWVIGTERVLVYDTGSDLAGRMAKELIRQQTDLPIAYIVYSHHHGTQITGAAALREDDTQIIAHEDLVDELDLLEELADRTTRLNSIQFNTPLLPRKVPLYPDITYTDTLEIDLGGVVVELLHMAGEAEGYSVMWMPSQRIAWMADLLPGGMPMVASPMKVVRDEVAWRRSLERIRDREPLGLLYTGHPAVCDAADIQAELDVQIRFLTFLHDAVIRELNLGHTAEEAVANIQLPPGLADHPRMRERYGTLSFAVRGLHHKYSGWFDQNGSNVLPAPTRATAKTLIADMGGRSRVLERARALHGSGKHKLACVYADLLLDAEPDASAHRVKADALGALASPTKNADKIERNMLRRTAKMNRASAAKLDER